MRSIRSRTLLLVLGLLGLSTTLISYKSYRDAHHEIEELFDAELAQQARLLGGMVSRGMPPGGRKALQEALDEAVTQDESGTEAQPLGHEYEKKLGFFVFDEHGTVLLRSASAPAPAATLDQLLRDIEPGGGGRGYTEGEPLSPLAQRLIGYHDVLLDAHHWRVFVLHDQRDAHWVLVGERDDVRGELGAKIALRSLLPDLVGLPLLALLVWLAVGWGLRPLGRMVQLLKTRDPNNLSPLLLAPMPPELEPMVAALNRMLLQVRSLLEREKRFLDYAAHELRTPLAVLRIHAQNALQAIDPVDRDDALRQLGSGVERATQVVAQLLTLARLEPSAVSLRMTELDLLAFVRAQLAELTPLALERRQELTLECAESDDYRLLADAPSLGTLLQNLVSNAVQHTPQNGQIRVLLQAGPQFIALRIEDSGPGVPPELRARVFERFFRQGPGQGAGLGLSIVARIVELHGGQLELRDSPLGGLAVLVQLPRLGPGAP